MIYGFYFASILVRISFLAPMGTIITHRERNRKIYMNFVVKIAKSL